MSARLLILIIASASFSSLSAQDSTIARLQQVPEKYFSVISSKSNALEDKLDRHSTKAIKKLQQQEAKMRQKISRIDSVAANSIFGKTNDPYKTLEEKLKSPGKLNQYIPRLDSMASSLNFLNQHSQLLSQTKDVKEKLKEAIEDVNGLKLQLQKAGDIKKFLKERKKYLGEQLSKFGFTRELKKLNKQVYYYAQKVNECKEILNDPKKIEKKALEMLSKTKLFKDFMRKNSLFASLFRIPADPVDPQYLASLSGLQTRVQVNGLIQQQILSGGSGGRQQFQQNLDAAQSQLNELKHNVLKLLPGSGGGSSDDIMPEGFRPNDQKTKSFLDRLELGATIQNQKAGNYFPTTSDVALSVGYKLNDRSIIGIGASYKIGFGRGWNNIRLSSEGVGLRSFVDWKIKGSFWISGGYEMNYRTAFKDFEQLRNMNGWQQSGLLGLSKSVPVKSKFFKKTKLMLLWDFLSYEQVPRTQPVIFRIGYHFK